MASVLDPFPTLCGRGAHEQQPKSTRTCLFESLMLIEILKLSQKGVHVVWTRYLPVRLHVGPLPKRALLGMFWKAFRLTGLTSGLLWGAIEAPEHILWDPFLESSAALRAALIHSGLDQPGVQSRFVTPGSSPLKIPRVHDFQDNWSHAELGSVCLPMSV